MKAKNRTVLFLLVSIASLHASLVEGQSAPPPTPVGLEAHPTASSGAAPIELSWYASSGATSYLIYRSTSSGKETLYATSPQNSYLDSAVAAGPPLVYFYRVAAVGPTGTSALSAETATPTPLPISRGSGKVAGVPSGNGAVYYCSDALVSGFDWFERLYGWFPSLHHTSGSISPSEKVVDMAYASDGTLEFDNVVVPSAGLYTISWRYAYAKGLFGSVTNRQMGLMVNGMIVTRTQRFPITGSFTVYAHSSLQVELPAGKSSIALLAVSDHGVSRVDQMTVTPASASVPSAPSSLVAQASPGRVSLSWTPGAGAVATQVYRGRASDGESLTPLATLDGAAMTFVDTTVKSGTLYYYNVSATNDVGISPDSNEISVTAE